RHPLPPGEQVDRGREGEAHRLPRDVPAVDRGGGDQPGDPHRRDDEVPGVRGAPVHESGPRADQGGPGARAAGVDRDVPAVHAAHREGDGDLGAARQDRPAAPPGGRPRRRRALSRQPRGLHRHRGQRSLAAAQGAQGAGLEEYLRGPGRQADSLRRPLHRDAGAAHVERGRGEARPARDLDGPGAGRESRAHLRPVSAEGRHPGGRRRRSHHHRSRRGWDDHGGRSSRHRGLDPLRGMEVEGPAVDDGAARAGAAEPGPPRAEAGLRAVPGADRAGGAAGRHRRVGTGGGLPRPALALRRGRPPRPPERGGAGRRAPRAPRHDRGDGGGQRAAREPPARRAHGRAPVAGGFDADRPRRARGPAARHVRQLHRGSRLGGGHPAIHVIPAALAVAEDTGAPGGRLLEAIVAGYEVCSRLGSATTPRPNVHSHGTWGTIGTAVAVAKLAGLGAVDVRAVINLSASMSPANTWTTALEGVTIRNAYPGRSGLDGILAVDLHRAGFTGLRDAPSDVYGTILAECFEPERALDGLGGPLRIQQNYFKLYACCRYNHFALDSLMTMRKAGEVRADEVERVIVTTIPFGPRMGGAAPASMLGAKFSIPYAVAAALVLGR